MKGGLSGDNLAQAQAARQVVCSGRWSAQAGSCPEKGVWHEDIVYKTRGAMVRLSCGPVLIKIYIFWLVLVGSPVCQKCKKASAAILASSA